jgi:Tfp pilus assembly protein FimT
LAGIAQAARAVQRVLGRDREVGFTQFDLMVTVAVIAILAAIALPSFFGETSTRKATIDVVRSPGDVQRHQVFLEQ